MSKVNSNQENEMLIVNDSSLVIDNIHESIYYPGKRYYEFLYGMKSDNSADNYDYCTAFMFA